MSNILIIKHGSLGDIIQANGAIKDIKKNFSDQKVMLLTTPPYADFMSSCPFLDGVLIDKRLPRWNLIYLRNLKKMIERFSFDKVFDLQNSSRTLFYKNILYPKSNYEVWSSSITTLPSETAKEDFDKISVLERFDHQLMTSSLKTHHTLKPDFSWACSDINDIKKKYELKNYILLFPFCSPHLTIKKWPYYNDLIKLINENLGSGYKIITAPGPSEVEDAKKFDAISILDNEKALNISQLTSLIKNSSFVIANDTGPAHIAAHVGAKGLTLFGKHTTAYKVSIERENFKAIQVNELKNLSAEKVFERLNNLI